MPSCPLFPFLIGKTNAKICAVKQCHAWHRTNKWPAQLPPKALTCAQQNNWEMLISAHKTLWSEGHSRKAGSSRTGGTEPGVEQRHGRAPAQAGTWVRKMRDWESPTKAKAGKRGWIGITCSLAVWEWWGIRWASREHVAFETTHANS